MLGDEDLRIEIREGEFEDAEEYGWDSIAAHTEDLYREIADKD